MSYYCPLDTTLLGLMNLCSDRRTWATAVLKGRRAKQKIAFEFNPPSAQHVSGASEPEVGPVKPALGVHHYLVAVLRTLLSPGSSCHPNHRYRGWCQLMAFLLRVRLSSPDIWGRLRVRKPLRLRSNGAIYWCEGELHLNTPTEQGRTSLQQHACRDQLKEQMEVDTNMIIKGSKRLWPLTLVKAKTLWSYWNLYYFCFLYYWYTLICTVNFKFNHKGRQLKFLHSLLGIMLHNRRPQSAIPLRPSPSNINPK